MRRARRFSAACMVVVVFAQGISAKPPRCESASGEHSSGHEHHSTVSFEHEMTLAQNLSVFSVAAVTRSGPSSDTPVSRTCVTMTHCSFNPVALECPALTFELPYVAAEGPGPTWFVHGTSTTHATPPPKV